MATPKKKHLIELMIDAGVKWQEGAEYAAQDKKDNRVHFYKDGKPQVYIEWMEWAPNECTFIGDKYGVSLPSLCLNWNKTIVTCEQYAEALASANTDVQHEARESHDIPSVDIVEWHNPPTIEQLTADYHAKSAEAHRLQSVADEALKAADDALLALEKAGELIGLVISIDTKPKQFEVVQPIITDWRDLRVGDVIECVGNWEGENTDGNTYHVTGLDPIGSNSSMPIQIQVPCVECPETWGGEFKFIRRP